MRTILLLSLSLTACATEADNESSITEVEAELVTADVATTACRPDLHLASVEAIREALGNCVASSIGWICAPSIDAGMLTNLGATATVWTDTSCTAAHGEPGRFAADLYTGEITCEPAISTIGHPFCAL